ncbi:hypothetical protein CEXT_192421 [Caerostris extrusa]|uniref:Uncharacterized protein n=1 Tax=Caerostris extrusa TaxID=172846 RepID=A0AAV4QM74_CAEEX|nr:hypothetical protein CEXT_192421 [Caerostris extrusa]
MEAVRVQTPRQTQQQKKKKAQKLKKKGRKEGRRRVRKRYPQNKLHYGSTCERLKRRLQENGVYMGSHRSRLVELSFLYLSLCLSLLFLKSLAQRSSPELKKGRSSFPLFFTILSLTMGSPNSWN